MNKLISTIVVLVLFSSFVLAQEENNTHIPLPGEFAPEFTAQSTMGKINFPGDYTMKWKILFSHMAWIQSLETISYPGENPVKIKFPLISDPDKLVSKKYGMIHSYTSNTKDVRGVFIIDPNDRISAIFFYPMNVGRNMEEIKRTLIALQTSEKYDILTPANWSPGGKVLIHSPVSQQEAEKMESAKNPDLTEVTWYMWFKTLPGSKR